MWKLRNNPRVEPITPALAKEFVGLDAVEMDRPLKERRLEIYKQILEAGLFRPVHWAKAWCKETRQWYRVNGRHTSTLFSSVNLEKYQPLFAQVEEYTCDTLKDVSDLWATYDSSLQTRSSTDINRSFAMSIPALKEFAERDMRIINLFVGALVFYRHPTQGGILPGATGFADRAELLYDHIPACKWVAEMLYNPDIPVKDSQALKRVPVVAAMIGTWYKSRAAATEFWAAVRDATGPTPQAPDRQLNRFLLEHSLVTRGAEKRIGVKTNPREFYVRAIAAWNHWRAGESKKLVYRPTADIPSIR